MAPARRVNLGGITGSPLALQIVVGLLVLALAVPLLHNGYYENLFRGILMFSAMALGWNLIGGYTGYVSFGNVVFLREEWLHHDCNVFLVTFFKIGYVHAACLRNRCGRFQTALKCFQ